MISESEIITILKETKMPVYRGHAPIGIKVPYIVLRCSYPDNFGADNVTYLRLPQYTAELYNDSPSLTARGKVENKLTEYGLHFTSDEADDEAQSLYITYYYFGGLN